MFKVSPASLQTFIDTPNSILEDRVQYSTVHIPNVLCDENVWNTVFFACFLYCNRQVHSDYLITLYKRTVMCSYSLWRNRSQLFASRELVKVKVKCTLVQALRLCTGRTAHRGSRGIALLFHNHGTRRGWGVSVTPRPLLPPGKTRYPLYKRLGGPQGRSGQVRKISPPPGFDPRTVQPVASRYTDCATRSTRELLQARKSIRTAGFCTGAGIWGRWGQTQRDCDIRSTKWGPIARKYNITVKNCVQWNGLSLWNKTDNWLTIYEHS